MISKQFPIGPLPGRGAVFWASQVFLSDKVVYFSFPQLVGDPQPVYAVTLP
jgi:hypothetical protein